MESFAFNVAVARVHELANAIAEHDQAPPSASLDLARREAMEVLTRLIAPMMPHLAEELHARLDPQSGKLVAELPWPEAAQEWLTVDTVTIAVQVMGRLRGTIAAPPDAAAAEVIEMAEREPNVARALHGKRIVKRIHVPNRIVNFVVTG